MLKEIKRFADGRPSRANRNREYFGQWRKKKWTNESGMSELGNSMESFRRTNNGAANLHKSSNTGNENEIEMN